MTTDLHAFNSLPADSRTWVYQAQRNLTDAEVAAIRSAGIDFIAGWAAHGHKLDAVVDVLYNRFVVLMVDGRSAAASGCSIDKSVGFIQSMSNQLGTDLLERLDLAYLYNGEVRSVHVNTMAADAEQGLLQPSTIVFNNMIVSKAELEINWRIPLSKSWARDRLSVLN